MGHVQLVEGRFPLLIKFLDAAQSLSVQVHPTKHEAWYVLAADPGGIVYHGLEPGINAETFREAMLTGRIEGVLRRIVVKPGRCYYLPSGTAHALGAGVLVAEIQTPSDITYRAYDWGRIDPKTGRPRELHLEQAIECIDFDHPAPRPMQERSHVASTWTAVTRLVTCPSFTIEKVRTAEGARQQIPYGEPVVWVILDGQGLIEWGRGGEPTPFRPGNVLLLPAELPAEACVQVTAAAQWLEVTVPVATAP